MFSYDSTRVLIAQPKMDLHMQNGFFFWSPHRLVDLGFIWLHPKSSWGIGNRILRRAFLFFFSYSKHTNNFLLVMFVYLLVYSSLLDNSFSIDVTFLQRNFSLKFLDPGSQLVLLSVARPPAIILSFSLLCFF